jgi:nanoRNase/pAp phosphatase (c-di-AMP/oligoRNAs hydrolase)
MHLAAELMEAGVDTDRMYQLLYQNERAERVALQTRALQSLELLEGGKLAVMTVTRDDFAKSRAAVPTPRTSSTSAADSHGRSVAVVHRAIRRRPRPRQPPKQGPGRRR